MTTLTLTHKSKMGRKSSKESIHSGHFMVSDFEAEAQDEEGLEVPEQNLSEQLIEVKDKGIKSVNHGSVITYAKRNRGLSNKSNSDTVSIDGSLTKLFEAMTMAYRQKITSPKWNPFKGLKLRWKDRLRLNNVIWRCWHLQFIKKQRMTICQFALDVDIHHKAEAVVLEGKYWKRRLTTVTAEYRKWRVYYKNLHTGQESFCDPSDLGPFGADDIDIGRPFFGSIGVPTGDCDLHEFDLMEVLFSPSNSNQGGFHFPNPREIARGMENSDLLQPGLMQLQPNVDDDYFMDFHEILPTVPEEEYFPDVEAPGLPIPSGSPPSVSTPHPPIAYSMQMTATPRQNFQDGLPSTQPSEFFPSSPFSINQHTSSHQTPTALEELSTVALLSAEPTDLSLSTPGPISPHSRYPPSSSTSSPTAPNYSCEGLQGHSTIGRSHSQQNLDTTSGLALLQESGGAFAVPKGGYPRRRSHSGSLTLSSATTGVVCTGSVINAASVPSLPFAVKADRHHQNLVQSTSSTAILTGSLPQAAIPAADLFSFAQAVKANPNAGTIPHSTAPGTIYAHFIPSESYPTLSSFDNSGNTKGKSTLPLVLPRVGLPDTSSSSSIFSTTNSNSSTNLITCKSSLPTMQLLVATSGSQASSMLPTVALSPVTPPSMKGLQHAYPPVSNFSTNFSHGGNSEILKLSPPHGTSSPPHGGHGPTPTIKPFRPKNEDERNQYKEHRRVCHINAEQKRRGNIKNNFEMLQSVIPSINQGASGKVSKATMLQKGAEYIQQLKEDRKSLDDQAKKFRAQIDKLSQEISTAQSLLPATGAPVAHSRHNKLRERYDNYIKEKTLVNWKYYLFSLVVDPLFESYTNNVSTSSVDDLCRSSMAWLDQHCSLTVLRPVASNAMRKLSTTTGVLAAPECLPEDICRIVVKQESSKLSCSSPSSSSSPFPS